MGRVTVEPKIKDLWVVEGTRRNDEGGPAEAAAITINKTDQWVAILSVRGETSVDLFGAGFAMPGVALAGFDLAGLEEFRDNLNEAIEMIRTGDEEDACREEDGTRA